MQSREKQTEFPNCVYAGEAEFRLEHDFATALRTSTSTC